jgi:hypothetical protein
LNAILKEAWTAARTATGKEKIQALDLAQRAYQMRLELLTNTTVMEDAVKFVEKIKKKNEEENKDLQVEAHPQVEEQQEVEQEE